MGVLTDTRLRELGPTLLYPFDPAMVQPASIDVHLDCYFRSARNNTAAYILNPAIDNDVCFDEEMEVPQGGSFFLGPNDFVLASTYEKVIMPNNLLARLEGKSSLGRLGLLTHITAGFIDPGFVGHITLELKNVTNFGLFLHPGMKIGQICFEQLDTPVDFPYGDPVNGSHYQGQRGPTLSRSEVGFAVKDVYSPVYGSSE